MKQFLYMLKLVPRLHEEESWTDRDNEIVDEHFAELQQLQNEGKLLLAGPTLNELERRVGLVILQVPSEEEAKEIMKNDPAVKKGVMTAELFPFHAALMSGQ